jgi:putative membrane protein
VLLDITLSVFTQIIFTVTGLALLAAGTKRFSAGPIVAGALMGVLAVAGFYAVQRYGIFRMIGGLVTRIAGDASWHSLVENCAALDRAVLDLYTRRRGLLASACATMTSWLLGAGEVWIALKAIGVSGQATQLPGGIFGAYLSALILESVGQGIRAASFFVPASLGLQEGGYLVVGGLLGIPPEAALALALIRRVREVAYGLPGLVGWQIVEARRAWQARAPQTT